MVIQKRTTINPLTTDGLVINVGDTVVFSADGKCFIGQFTGISPKGAMCFDGKVADIDVKFNVRPSSIDKILLVDSINTKLSPFPMNPPVEESEV